MTCGTCLDYYGLKDKLAVGSVTNMYSIVETQAKQLRSLNHKMSTRRACQMLSWGTALELPD